MASIVSVAEAKRRSSEIMSRVVYKGERFIIQRRGKTVAALVSPQDLERLEHGTSEPDGLLAAAGILSDSEAVEWDKIVEDIYRQHGESMGRKVNLSD